MKRINKLSLLLILSICLLSATACDNVYYTAVSGRVEDASGNGISGVNVYAYTSQAERDSKYNSYEYGQAFDDPRCLFRATTTQSGDFSIGKVVWKESGSKWGKDYSSTTLYFIFFSEDYGIKKEEGVNIISGSSNGSAVTVNMGAKITTSSTLTLHFKDASNEQSSSSHLKDISDIISFTYSYNNGYRTITEDVASAETGTFPISLKFVKAQDGGEEKNSTKITISNIKSAEGLWTVRNQESREDSNYVFEVSSAVESENINLRREKWDLGTGISGTITNDDNIPLDGSIVHGSITVKEEKFTDDANVSSTNIPERDNSTRITGTYSGLFAGFKVPATYTDDGNLEDVNVDIKITVNGNEYSSSGIINAKTGNLPSLSITIPTTGQGN